MLWLYRVKAEKERLKEIGPLAYYSEWVKAWKKDTSREAVQKHFEETGEDENTQLIEMFSQAYSGLLDSATGSMLMHFIVLAGKTKEGWPYILGGGNGRVREPNRFFVGF
ncbi:hypothetical protein Droror1_Dr00011265 [Drosera rotundifolia]